MKFGFLIVLIVLEMVGSARAGEPAGGALLTNGVPLSGYSLFHPVPQDKLREFDSDRPDQAVGAHTVDAGHIYLEMDFANYTRDRHSVDGKQIDQWNVAPVNLRVGLLPTVELDFQYDGYINVRTRDRTAAHVRTQSGFGDLALRSKINLIGDDDGKFAFAVFPLVRLPASSAGLASQSVEGGIGLAVSAKLPGDFTLTASADFQVIRNSTDAYYDGDYLDAISLAHGLGIKHLSGFVEFASEVSSESPSAAACQVDAGVLYQINDHVQLDVDCYFGVTRNAPDYVPFAGLAVRF